MVSTRFWRCSASTYDACPAHRPTSEVGLALAGYKALYGGLAGIAFSDRSEDGAFRVDRREVRTDGQVF